MQKLIYEYITSKNYYINLKVFIIIELLVVCQELNNINNFFLCISRDIQ